MNYFILKFIIYATLTSTSGWIGLLISKTAIAAIRKVGNVTIIFTFFITSIICLNIELLVFSDNKNIVNIIIILAIKKNKRGFICINYSWVLIFGLSVVSEVFKSCFLTEVIIVRTWISDSAIYIYIYKKNTFFFIIF